MPATTRKRQRGALAAVEVLASSVSSLVSRVDARATPRFWRHAASSAAGIAGAEGFLVHLGRSISAALQSVAESAATARTQLREAQAVLHAAIDARCEDLISCINSSEATKVACLERELIAVDAALERWRVDTGAVRESVSSLSDTELEVQHSTLSSRLDALETQLQALPTAVVEPPFVGLHADALSLLSSIAGFGRVHAPLSIAAADLTLEDLTSNGMRRGGTLRLRLSLGARHAAQSAEELEVSLGRLTGTMRVEVALEGPDIEPQILFATIAPDAFKQCFAVTVGVPTSTTSGVSVCIAEVNVAGQSMSGMPLRLSLLRGITVPLTIKCALNSDTCISPEGRLYCTPGDGSKVLVFDADGSSLPGISPTSLGFEHGSTLWATYTHCDTASLLLADGKLDTTRLVAVDPATHAVRWVSAAKGSSGCQGIAALPSLGVVIVCSARPGNSHGRLSAYRLSDGSLAGSLACEGLDYYAAADSDSGTVFGCVLSDSDDEESFRVHAFHCAIRGTGVQLTSDGPIAAAGISDRSRLLTVVPPAPGKTVSHLVIGTELSPELRVLSLPGLALVHRQTLQGVRVVGLAADPWGEALAVCDFASVSIHVLAWPLPGMPPLQ